MHNVTFNQKPGQNLDKMLESGLSLHRIKKRHTTFHMDKKSVSIIIPTYNGAHLLKDYLPHTVDVIQQSNSISEFEIIIIDDASTDETRQYLENVTIPNLTIIINECNSGFSKTINKGIRQAKMDLCLLLNNDMDLPLDFFDVTIPYFTDNSIFGISTEIRDRAGKNIIESRKLPVFKHRTFNYKNTTDVTNSNTLYLCGGNSIVDTIKLKELNGFNELFSPFYFEDFDLSLRAWRKGWKSIYINSTFCKHTPSTTIRKENRNSYVEAIFIRNKLLLNYLHSTTANSILLCFRTYCKIFLYSFSNRENKRIFIKPAKDFLALKKEADKQRKIEYNNLNPIDWSLF